MTNEEKTAEQHKTEEIHKTYNLTRREEDGREKKTMSVRSSLHWNRMLQTLQVFRIARPYLPYSKMLISQPSAIHLFITIQKEDELKQQN